MAVFVPTYATTIYVRELTPYVVFTLCFSALLLVTLNIFHMLQVFINNFTNNLPIQQYKYNLSIIATILCFSAILYVKIIDILFPPVPLYYIILLWLISITPYIISGVILYYIFTNYILK